MSERLQMLTRVLQVIEENLQYDITPLQVAEKTHYSLSMLQKVFHHAYHLGLAGYISRRRITVAARELLTTQRTVLEIALRYGYASHEVFTRAFKRIWGVTPNQFRRSRSFADIYPQYTSQPFTTEQGGVTMRYKFDTTLYDTIRTMESTMAIVFDTYSLSFINREYGRSAGDLVIAECLRRIDLAKEPQMPLFRIGGDEYVLLTGYTQECDALRLAETIWKHNDETISFGETAIPVAMRYACVRLETLPEDKDALESLFFSQAWKL